MVVDSERVVVVVKRYPQLYPHLNWITMDGIGRGYVLTNCFICILLDNLDGIIRD